MRATIILDDDVFDLVKRRAKARSMTMGKVLSELARRGAEEPVKTRKMNNGLVIFDLPEYADRVTTEHVKRLLG